MAVCHPKMLPSSAFSSDDPAAQVSPIHARAAGTEDAEVG